MNMKKSTITISCLLLAASAQSADLAEIFSQSQQHDPQLSDAKNTQNASLESKKQSFSAFLPQVTASWSTGESNTDSETTKEGVTFPSSIESQGQNWNVNLTQSIYDHANYKNYQISELEVLKSASEYEVAYQDFVLRVAQNYFNVLAAKDSLIFSKAEEKAIQRQLEQAEQRFEVGLAAITDVHEARARFDSSRASVILADNQLQDANEALFEMTQRYYPELNPVPNDLDYDLFVLETVETYQKNGLAINPELMVSKINRDIAEKRIALNKSGHLPTLSLSLTKSGSNSPNTTSNQIDFNTGLPVSFESGKRSSDTKSASINLNVPIYSGGRTSSQVKQSVHLYNASLDRFEQTLRGITRKVRNSYHGAIASKSSVNARKLAMVSAQSGLEATEAGYEVGTRTIVDVLNSQRSLYQAQRDYSKAKYDYFITLLELKKASGILTEEDILKINKILE
jgi:outer membrane protein